MRFVLCVALVLLHCQGAQTLDPFEKQRSTDAETADRKLPNGKSQTDEILKNEHAKSLQDLRQIAELAQALTSEMERDTSHVLSLSSIRKADEIEKLARRIRARMRR